VPAHFELRIDPAEKMHPLLLNIDPAFVTGTIEAAKLWVSDELLGGLLRQIAVTTRHVDTADTEFSNLSMREWSELTDFENHIGDIGERRPNRDGLPGTQTLAAGISAAFGWAIRVYDLPSAPGPGFHERCRKRFTRWHYVPA